MPGSSCQQYLGAGNEGGPQATHSKILSNSSKYYC